MLYLLTKQKMSKFFLKQILPLFCLSLTWAMTCLILLFLDNKTQICLCVCVLTPANCKKSDFTYY